MSIMRMADVHEKHPLQPVVPKKKGMEAPDRDATALQIANEIDGARNKALPFAGYYTTNEAGDESEETTD